MSWALTLGGPHGGPLPSPQVDDLPSPLLYPGDTLIITGSGFTPGSQIIVEPGSKVIGTASPTDTTSITVIIPFDLPNVKHKLYISNGNKSNNIDLFILRDVTLTSPVNTIAAISFSGAN